MDEKSDVVIERAKWLSVGSLHSASKKLRSGVAQGHLVRNSTAQQTRQLQRKIN